MSRSQILPFLLLLGIACAEPETRPGDSNSSGANAADAGDSALNASPSGADAAVCLADGGFVGNGAVTVEPPAGGDAREVSDLRWSRHEGCERFVIDLAGDDGAPALSPGVVSADVLRDLGVVRISLREVEQVDGDATEASFDGQLARSAYAVRSPDGPWMFVDLHLREAAEARVIVLDEPARVVVDLRPGGAPLPAAPAVDQRVVVLEPRTGSATYPLTVTGYARTFEANVVARIEQDGEELGEVFTTATAWADAWGHYGMTIEDGPPGPTTLHVGEHSARDGTWEGAEVALDMR